MNSPDEEALWNHFRNGSQQAFSTLYTTYFTILYQYGYHIAQDEDLVNDCIQTLFVELWKSRRNLAPTTSIKYYLLRVMRRKVYRALYTEGQSVPYVAEADTENVVFSPELDLIARQTTTAQQERLHQAIDQLSARQKEAITLLYIEGLSYTEASDLMAIKVRTVYNLIHTALESLRSFMNQPGLWTIVALITVC